MQQYCNPFLFSCRYNALRHALVAPVQLCAHRKRRLEVPTIATAGSPNQSGRLLPTVATRSKLLHIRYMAKPLEKRTEGARQPPDDHGSFLVL